MKFKQVLKEAVVVDKRDHYSWGKLNFYLNGREKHVKEEIQVHVFNFTKKNENIIINYYGKEKKYMPVDKNKPKDEIHVTKKNFDLRYKDMSPDPIQRQFDNFNDLYEFIMERNKQGNSWPYKLMENILNISRDKWRDKNMYSGPNSRRPKENYFNTINSQSKKFEMAVKWHMINEKTSFLQDFVIIENIPYKGIKVKYGKYAKDIFDLEKKYIA